MEHLDQELLSLLALGESASGPVASVHLAGCPDCQRTLAALTETVTTARSRPDRPQLHRPGSHNWSEIHRALGLSAEFAPDPLGAGDSAAVTGAIRDAQPTTDVRGRGRVSWLLPAAAGVVLGAAAAWAVVGLPVRAQPSVAAPTLPPAVLEEATLQPLGGSPAGGEALVQDLGEGKRHLVVHLPASGTSGYREVWVSSVDLSKMVSLGVLGGNSGTFLIPAGLDLREFPLVDVSHEPFDGDPAHSLDSLARGTLAPPREIVAG